MGAPGGVKNASVAEARIKPVKTGTGSAFKSKLVEEGAKMGRAVFLVMFLFT